MIHYKFDTTEKNISLLMKEYFDNKKELKKIKEERRDYSVNNNCWGHNCIADIEEKERWCPVCKERNVFYDKIRKVAHRNSSILASVRSLVYKNECSDA